MKLPEGVRFLELHDFEKVKEIWEKMNAIEGLFDDFHKDRFDIFMAKLQSRDTVWLEKTDGNGLLYLTSVIAGLSANGHIVYWDRRLRGREGFTMEVLSFLMEVIPLAKINVFLPEYAAAAHAFADRCGFRREGKIRRWSMSKGKLFDVHIFGMTKEEAEKYGKYVRAERPGVHAAGVESSPGLVQEPNGDDASVADA